MDTLAVRSAVRVDGGPEGREETVPPKPFPPEMITLVEPVIERSVTAKLERTGRATHLLAKGGREVGTKGDLLVRI